MSENTTKTDMQHLPINQETLDIIVANVIPTSKYFEVRFDHLEKRVDGMQISIVRIQDDIQGFRDDVNTRFVNLNEHIDNRFTDFRKDIDNRFTDFKNDIDNRFTDFKNDVDLRFEQVDKRFEQMITSIDSLTNKLESSIDRLSDKLDTSIDRISDKFEKRDTANRAFTIRMFSISIMISFLGVLGVFLKLFQVM